MSVATSMQSINDEDMSYLLLRTALKQFEKSPTQLSSVELNAIKRQAIKEHEIQNIVLSSDEARDIYIPESVVQTSLNEIKHRYNGDDEFLHDIESNGMSESGFL